MPGEVEVVILADNAANAPELSTEHGLSMWVTVDGKRILFDTGMGVVLPGNTAALGIDLNRTDAIVLSHGHFDHTGGLPYVFEQGIAPTIFMHPDAVGMRYGCLQTPPHKPIGMRPEIAESLSARSADIVPTIKPTQVTNHLWVTGPIPRRTFFEDTGGPFFVDEECRVKDPITDDQAIWMETAEGIVVLLGCAHSGVVNTLDDVAKVTGATQFRAVVGGMHLLNASEERLASTVDALKRYQVKLIAPCHCTGDTVMPILAERFPEHCARAGAGSRFTWSACD
jgi:7,8-dihydropterin-6-yl-methyl-4-(beta-D-ribofuranosyl)aminobenzene 5'-phosphate synthase